MSVNNLSKPAVLMVIMVVAIIGSWEIYLRQKGVAIAYDDNGAMVILLILSQASSSSFIYFQF